MEMSLIDSLLVALFCVFVVFTVLCGLFIVLEIFSKVFVSFNKAKTSGGDASKSG